jgi:hypothetical protein
VYIYVGVRIEARQREIFLQRFARDIGKRRSIKLAEAGVAERTQIDLTIARRSGRIHDPRRGSCRLFGALSGLTGPIPDVKQVCARFGVEAWTDEGLMTHSLHIVVVDRQGKLAANLEGNQFTALSLGDLVETVMNARN